MSPAYSLVIYFDVFWAVLIDTNIFDIVLNTSTNTLINPAMGLFEILWKLLLRLSVVILKWYFGVGESYQS